MNIRHIVFWSVLLLVATFVFQQQGAIAQSSSDDTVKQLISKWDAATESSQSSRVKATTTDPSGAEITLLAHWASPERFTLKQIRHGQAGVNVGCYKGAHYRFNPRLNDFELLPEGGGMPPLLAALSGSALLSIAKSSDEARSGGEAEFGDTKCNVLLVPHGEDNEMRILLSKESGLPTAIEMQMGRGKVQFEYLGWGKMDRGVFSFEEMKLHQNGRIMEFAIEKVEPLSGDDNLPEVPDSVIKQLKQD